MKVSIIGGGGRVGSDAAFALQLGGIVNEMVLVDANADMAAGEALDLRHGSALSSSQKIHAGDYDAITGSDCVVITAGLRRKPDESRLELINRNVGLFRQILDSLKAVKLADGATILVVSNPVDLLTQLAIETGMLPEAQIVGLGTVLDTCRFRSLLADHFGVGARDVNALILGEHGDSMVPIWSSASINGMSIKSLAGYDDETAKSIFGLTKTSGSEVIRMKGGAGRAVGISIKEVVESFALDQGAILPISAMQNGKLGISGTSLSLPTRVGRKGVVEIIAPSVSDEEREGLLRSAEQLKNWRAQIE